MKKVLLFMVCLFAIVGCTKQEQGILDFKKEYEAYNGVENLIDVSIDKDSKVVYLNPEQTVNFLKKKTGIIYFGFPNCPWCRNIILPLLEIAKENKLTVYYMNPREYRDSDDEKFDEIMQILDPYLQAGEDGEKVLYVPDVYFIKKGKVIGHHLGSADTQTNPTIPLTDEQRQELTKIYSDLIGQLK